PVHRLESLRELARDYRICLLSNTNPIMMNGKIAEEFRKEGREMADYFDGIFTSYEARCCKPGKEIFDYAEREGGLVPSETLFFDDSQSNVDAARSFGFKAVLVRPGDEFTTLLSEFRED
ncbi:MAG: HAD-IA family hydrolase, partial [Duncaniella sp.]|nr:HAD-IA family hydrolase [Duncaniella sp.]